GRRIAWRMMERRGSSRVFKPLGAPRVDQLARAARGGGEARRAVPDEGRAGRPSLFSRELRRARFPRWFLAAALSVATLESGCAHALITAKMTARAPGEPALLMASPPSAISGSSSRCSPGLDATLPVWSTVGGHSYFDACSGGTATPLPANPD